MEFYLILFVIISVTSNSEAKDHFFDSCLKDRLMSSDSKATKRYLILFFLIYLFISLNVHKRAKAMYWYIAWWPALDFTGCLAARCLREGVPGYCLLKNVSYLLANLLEIISLTLRDHGVRVNCPAKMWETGDTY